MHAAMVIAVGFALIILAGTLLLMLPCAAKSGRATPFIDALFTATSATCVTGLVTVGTAVHWSLFGKCVILLLIQIGGLGFMSVMTATSLLLRRTITLRERMVIGAGFGLDSSGGIVRLMRRVPVRGCRRGAAVHPLRAAVRAAARRRHGRFPCGIGVLQRRL